MAIFATLALLFITFPQIDLAASGLFFAEGRWLVARDSTWLAIPYRGLPRLGQITVLVILLLWLGSFIPRLNLRIKSHRVTFGFLLVAALAGPTLLVDLAIKDFSGRARPINVEAFGGAKTFTPAFIPANQCRKNCSFVSGHVATASFLMAFGWLAAPARRRRWLLAGMLSGASMGLIRMVPGGHFLSDVIFAWFAVYFSLWLVEWLFHRLGWLPEPKPEP